MINNILKLIIEEAQAEHDIPLPFSFRKIMFSLQGIIDTKIMDIARVNAMEIPDEQKARITNLILHID
ncbi:hypothetical protein ES702_05318 [subsurface metagenome]